MKIQRLMLASAAALALAGPARAEDKVQTNWYTVVDGYKVDAKTFAGFRTWRAAACDRCHGANQEGLVGPSLLDALKVLTPEQFKQVVTDGRPDRGMPGYKTSNLVMSNLDNLYAYLKGRADGAIKRTKVELLQDRDTAAKASEK
jgi:mono/diheme cytochrome c family protein